MAVPIEIPEWLVAQSAPPAPPPPVDDHRVEGLVNGFIAGKQDALFDAPDAYYRTIGADAVNGAPAIARRLQDLRTATLDQARDDGERAALGPRLDAHMDDAMDGIGRHLDAQQQVLQRQIISERQGLIQRAATLEHDNDDKIAGLAEANASAAQERARLDGVAPGSDAEAQVLNAARSQILRPAIEQRIANAKGAQAIILYDRMNDALTPADRRALEVPIGATRDDTATDAWLARETGKDGPPLADRAAGDDGLTDLQRLILQTKIGARESAAESSRVATVKGLGDQLAAATKAIAAQPAQYRIGTLNDLAQAYAAADEPDKANDTRQLASQESVLRLFAQAGVGAQQRALQGLSGPERTMAEAIMNHQAEAFAKDSYAAGTDLYPDVGPALPEEDAAGRLRQERMIEARRQPPPSIDTTNVQPSTGRSDRVWTDEQPPENPDPNLVLAADEPSRTSLPNDDVELAKAQPRQPPASKSQQTSPKPPAKPQAPAQTKPGDRPQRTPEEVIPAMDARAKEWSEIVKATPVITERGQQLLPDDWEKTIDKINPNYSKWTKEAAERYGIPPLLLARMLYKETGYNATAVNKATGARGIAQLLPGALQSIKKDPNTFNYFDAKASIEAGAAYLAWNNNWYKDWAKSVAAYNWGIRHLDDWLSGLPMVLNGRKEWVPAPSIPDETKTTISHIFRGSRGAFDN